jgi:hypothetical protein
MYFSWIEDEVVVFRKLIEDGNELARICLMQMIRYLLSMLPNIHRLRIKHKQFKNPTNHSDYNHSDTRFIVDFSRQFWNLKLSTMQHHTRLNSACNLIVHFTAVKKPIRSCISDTNTTTTTIRSGISGTNAATTTIRSGISGTNTTTTTIRSGISGIKTATTTIRSGISGTNSTTIHILFYYYLKLGHACTSDDNHC